MSGGADVDSLSLLPDKLKTELALHVNLHTLKKVSIFRECQPEFLHDLVLKMRAIIFTPGDIICRKGEIAREMYLIADGVLEVLNESGGVLATLKSGDFFGEIGVLNLHGGINRRTADVRSVGYSELFYLTKDEVWAVMKDHPEAASLLREYGQQRLISILKSHDLSEPGTPVVETTAPEGITPGLAPNSDAAPNQILTISMIEEEPRDTENVILENHVEQSEKKVEDTSIKPILRKTSNRGTYQTPPSISAFVRRNRSRSCSHPLVPADAPKPTPQELCGIAKATDIQLKGVTQRLRQMICPQLHEELNMEMAILKNVFAQLNEQLMDQQDQIVRLGKTMKTTQMIERNSGTNTEEIEEEHDELIV